MKQIQALNQAKFDTESKIIGIDLDNTIVSYDGLFFDLAWEMGLISSSRQAHPIERTKMAVRDAVRALPEGERHWQELQRQVYGPRMGDAVPFPGVQAFIRQCRAAGWTPCIVSHKTQYAGVGANQVDLRSAAWKWLELKGVVTADATSIRPEHVYFEETRSAKLERIQALGCSLFIDDLVEVLCDPLFPTNTQRILLFASGEVEAEASGQPLEIWCFSDWEVLRQVLVPGGPEE